MITTKTVISSDGGSIYAESTGDPTKPALIFIPGWTLPCLVFEKQFEDEELKKAFYLIRYDPRGHGLSVMPQTEEGHISKLYADDFAAVCEGFGIVKPVVAVWSLAGAIVCDICEHLGHETISGVIYLASLPYLSPTFLSQVCSPDIFAHLDGLLTTEDVATHKKSMLAFGRSLFIDPDSIPLKTRLTWAGGSLLQPPIVTKLVLYRKQDPTKLFEAGKKGLKVVFAQGSDDFHRLTPTIIPDVIGEHFVSKEVAVLEGAGHAFFYERPEATNQHLIQWTRRILSS